MRILVISQYFYPENFRINDLCLSLKKRGHKISVLTGKPNYPKGEYFEGYSWNTKSFEKIKGIDVYRSNLFLRKNGKGFNLVLNYLSFSFFATLKLFWIDKKFDKILIYAPSPITVGFIGFFAKIKFKVKSFLWVHDLWPESVKVAGNIHNKFILSLINNMTSIIYSLNDIVLVQSPLFKDYIKRQGVADEKLIYYPYYAEDFYKPLNINEKNIYPKGFNIVFAGNIGVAQSFDTIINAAQDLKESNFKVNFIIIGDGRDKKRVKGMIESKNLEDYFYFLGSFKPKEMSRFFHHADALLVSLKKSEIFYRTIPGKLQSYLASGKPIIGSIDGITCQIINNSNCGFCAPAEDSKNLSLQIKKFYNLPIDKRNELGKNALNYYKEYFEKQKVISNLETIFNKY